MGMQRRPSGAHALLAAALALALGPVPAHCIRAGTARGRGGNALQEVSEEVSAAFSERFLGLRQSIVKFLAEGQASNSTAQAMGTCKQLADVNGNITKDPELASAFCAAPKDLRRFVQKLVIENKALKKQLQQAEGLQDVMAQKLNSVQQQLQQAQFVPTTFTPTTTRLLWHGPPPPPPCGAPPPLLEPAQVSMGLAPFKPLEAVGNVSGTQDGGLVWKLRDGGWAFQYPDMLAHVEQDGRTLVAWAKQGYAVDMHEGGITYHAGDTVVHRSVSGRVIYQRPAGTIHQAGDTLIYHWCKPNMIIYHTPAGIVYYDNDGMTYRGSGVAHYAPNGEVLYQGVGGVTHLYPTGAVTHWTSSGAIYRHADGVTFYTPTGESTPQVLPTEALGADPFPGPPLTIQQVLELASQAVLPTLPPPPLPTFKDKLDSSANATGANATRANATSANATSANATPQCAPCANSSLGPPPPLPVALMNVTAQ